MNPNRHAAQCRICQHPDKARIEADYCAYRPVDQIAADHDVCRDAVYRHAAAFPQLSEQRSSNLTGLCSWIVEKGQREGIEVTPALFAAAMTTSAKLRGAFIADRENINLEAASNSELAFFEVHGRLPKPGELAPEPTETQ